MPPVQFKVTPTALQAGDAALVRRGENVAAVTLGDAATKAVGTAAGEVAPGDHGHAIADVTGLQAALEGKAAADHEHEIADIPDLEARLATQDGAIAEVQGQIDAIVLPEAIVPTGDELVAILQVQPAGWLDASAVDGVPVGESLKTAAQHTADNTSLVAGQRGRESDTQKEKVGPGVWNSLPYVGAWGAFATAAGVHAPIINTAAWLASNDPPMAAGQVAIATDTGAVTVATSAGAFSTQTLTLATSADLEQIADAIEEIVNP